MSSRGLTSEYAAWMGADKLDFDFQAMLRTPECKAAMIVYEKYRRSLKLAHKDLLEMHGHALAFSVQRQLAGKKAGKDLLVQEVSRYCKERYGTAGRTSAGGPAGQLVSQTDSPVQSNAAGDLGQAPAPAPPPGEPAPLPGAPRPP